MQNLFCGRCNTEPPRQLSAAAASVRTDHDQTSIGLLSQPIGPPPPPGLRPPSTARGNGAAPAAVSTMAMTTTAPTEPTWVYRSAHVGSHVLVPAQESTSHRKLRTLGHRHTLPDALSLVASGPDLSPPAALASGLISPTAHDDKNSKHPSPWYYRVLCIVAPLIVVSITASLAGFLAHSTMQGDINTVSFSLSGRCMQLASQIENDLTIRVVDQMSFASAFLATSPSVDRATLATFAIQMNATLFTRFTVLERVPASNRSAWEAMMGRNITQVDPYFVTAVTQETMNRYRSGELVPPPPTALPLPHVTNDTNVYWPLYTIMPTYGLNASVNVYHGALTYPIDQAVSGIVASSVLIPVFNPQAVRQGVLPVVTHICVPPVTRIVEAREFMLCASFDHTAYDVAVVQPSAVSSGVYMSMAVEGVVVFKSLHDGIDAQQPPAAGTAPTQSQGTTIETLVNVQHFSIVGRTWSLICAPTPSFVASLRHPWVFTIPFIILLCGLILAGLVADLARRMSKLWQTESLLDLWQSYSQAILLATPNPMVLVNELGVVEGVNYPLMLLTGHSPLSITHVTDIDQLFSIAAEPDEAGGMGDAMTDHTFSDVTSSIRSPSSSSATGSATPTMTRRSTATAVALSPRRVILPDMPLSPSGAHFSDITTCVSEHDDAHDDDAHDDDDHLVSPRTPIHSNKSLVIDTRIGMLSPGVSSLLRPGQHKVVICCAHPPPLQPDSELFDSSELLPSQSAWGDQTWSALTSLPSALTYQRAIDRQAAAAGTTAALHLREVSAAAAVVTPIIAVAGVAPTPGHPTVSKVIVLTDLSELHARDRQLRALVHETAALNLKQRQLLLFLAHELRNPLYVVQGHMETDVDDEVDAKKKNLAMEAINFSTAILDGLVEYIEAGHALFDLPVHGPADQDTVHVRVRDLFSDGPPRPDIEALATLPPCVQCTFPVASVLRKLAAFCHGMPVPGTSSLFVSPERHVQLHQWTASGDRAVIHLVFLSTICDTQVAILGQPLSWLSTGSVVQDPSVRLLSLQLAVLSRAIMQSGGSLRVDLTRRMVEIEVVGCRVCGDPGCQPLPPLSPLHVTPAATAAATADDDMALLSPTATSPQLESIPPVAPPPRLLPEEETPATTTTAAPPPPLVLLVEDNRIVQKMTRRLLERAGLAVLVAEHGQQALNMLRDKNSDLAATVRVVLMDLQMPVMGGIECTEIIRHEEVEWRGDQGRRLPIVALTANAMAEERDRCLATGFDGFLTKPVNRETLVAELRLRIGEW